MLCSCFVEAKTDIITEDLASNPWPLYQTVVFREGEEKVIENQSFAINIFEDNVIRFDALNLKAAYSEILSNKTGYQTYVLAVPQEEGERGKVTFIENPKEFMLIALIVNERGDFDLFAGGLMCSESVSTFVEAEKVLANCFDRMQPQFTPRMTFVSGIPE